MLLWYCYSYFYGYAGWDVGYVLYVYSVCYQMRLGDPSSLEKRSKVMVWEPVMMFGPVVLAECG